MAELSAFLSYTRRDDQTVGGLITKLKDVLEEHVEFVTGQPIDIFLDTDDIGLGQDWRQRLESAIQDARFFIPVITPRYFNSSPCTFEMSRFHALEQAASRSDLILPIYLQTADVLEEDGLRRENPLAIIIEQRNYADWRGLYPQPLDSIEGKRLVRDLALKIKEAIAKVPALPASAMPLQNRIDSLETALASKSGELHALREQAATFRDEAESLRAGSEEEVRLKSEIDDKNATISRISADLGRTRQEYEVSRQSSQIDKRQIEKLRATIAALEQAKRANPAFVGPKIATAAIVLLACGGLAGWYFGNSAQTQQIDELESEVDAKVRIIDQLEVELKKRPTLKQVAELQARAEGLEGELASRPKAQKLADLMSTIDQRDRSIEELTAEVARLEEAQAARMPVAFSNDHQAGETFRDCEACPEMVVVPAGSFLMGSPEDEEGRDGDEGPQHRVTLGAPFAVGRFAVTFDEWDACIAAGGCDGYRPDDEGWGRGKRPVISVSWDDAQAYVKWLSTETGEAYRLLSEAEWEYAARAGTTTPFHFGETISTDQANYDGNFTYGFGRKGQYRAQTVPVGSFAANAFGLFDVHGNVWEWVEDRWHDSYEDAPIDGTAWIAGTNSRRVLRGGSWFDSPRGLRAADRNGGVAGGRNDVIGFRVARTLR